jgi:hypothetical protein
MRSLIKYMFLLTPLSAILFGCGGGSVDITDFQKGDVVAWRMLNDKNHIPSTEQDCGKAFEDKNGMISVYQNIDNKQVVTLLWGKATDRQKIDASFMQIYEPNGLKVPAEIINSTLKGDKLEQVVSQPNGFNYTFEYSQNKKEKNQIRLEAETPVITTARQAAQYKSLKAAGAYEPRNFSYCTASSFKKYVEKELANKPNPDIKIDNSLNYVLDKKWSKEDTSCRPNSLNGGQYQMFTRSSPKGYILYINGNPQILDSPQEYEFTDVNANQFIHKATVLTNEFMRQKLRSSRNIIASEEITEVKLINPRKIEYSAKYNQLDMSELWQGRVVYKTTNKTGYGYLCE